jgi:hypothetical protein
MTTHLTDDGYAICPLCLASHGGHLDELVPKIVAFKQLREIDTAKLRLLADWFDLLGPPGAPNEVQAALQRWADLLDAVRSR